MSGEKEAQGTKTKFSHVLQNMWTQKIRFWETIFKTTSVAVSSIYMLVFLQHLLDLI